MTNLLYFEYIHDSVLLLLSADQSLATLSCFWLYVMLEQPALFLKLQKS